ncbi:dicarboxylate transporter 2, chloroplastic-like [Salvia splendens]|uniref:dicarboxylate transporter 2, chloroplastic-like n=1 Tax=Salvia splendens TaxID=180675 RepID=UPI001C27FC7D|nr:dicarboxylate transporter 2, chloroplastic-like [Salvia splendens]
MAHADVLPDVGDFVIDVPDGDGEHDRNADRVGGLAIVPGLVSLIVVPFVLYVIYPPTVKSSPDAPKLAREKLAAMGPMSKNEIIMAGTLVLRVGLWYAGCGFSERRHIRTVSAAYNRGSDVEGMPSRIRGLGHTYLVRGTHRHG